MWTRTQQGEEKLGPHTRLNVGLSTSSLQWMVNNNVTRTAGPTSWSLATCRQAGPRSLRKGLWHHLWQWYFHLLGRSGAKIMNRAKSGTAPGFQIFSTSSYCTNSCVQLLLEELPAYGDEKRLWNWNSVAHASATARNIWESQFLLEHNAWIAVMWLWNTCLTM